MDKDAYGAALIGVCELRVARGYKFTANDGVQTTDTILIHVGTGSDAITTNTAHTLQVVSGQVAVEVPQTRELSVNRSGCVTARRGLY